MQPAWVNQTSLVAALAISAVLTEVAYVAM